MTGLPLLMDRAYEGDETRQLALDLGFTPVVPPKTNRRNPWQHDRDLYKRRNAVERLFRRLKGFDCPTRIAPNGTCPTIIRCSLRTMPRRARARQGDRPWHSGAHSGGGKRDQAPHEIGVPHSRRLAQRIADCCRQRGSEMEKYAGGGSESISSNFRVAPPSSLPWRSRVAPSENNGLFMCDQSCSEAGIAPCARLHAGLIAPPGHMDRRLGKRRADQALDLREGEFHFLSAVASRPATQENTQSVIFAHYLPPLPIGPILRSATAAPGSRHEDCAI